MTKGWFALHGAVYILFIRDGQLLLLRRTNTKYENGKLGLVAGKLDGGEDVLAAAVREAWEESGVKVEPADLAVVGVMHRSSDAGEWVDFFLRANRWEGEFVNNEPDQCSELVWAPVDALPEDMIPHVRKAVDNVLLQGTFYEGYGWT
jgi:8-oxo-dGTP diphosphatase